METVIKNLIKKIILISSLSVIALNAQTFNIKKSWNLLGATEDINNLTSFNQECISSIYTYSQKDWNIYPKGDLTSIDKGTGFWLQASKDCTIDTSKLSSEFNAKVFFLSNCKVCHGDQGQGARFKAISGNNKAWYLSKLKPFQDGSRTSPSIMSGILKDFNINNLDSLAEFLPTLGSSQSAKYQLTFNATWSSSTHAKNFPSNPHFSPLIGGTHNDKIKLWERGEKASAGIKLMAETGRTSSLENIMKSEKNKQNIQYQIKSSPLSPSPKSITVEFTASKSHSYLSLVSMVAPSPDWFIGINSLKLLDDNNNWIDSKTINLKVYDSGTDSGTNFTSSDSPTSPQENISLANEPDTDFIEGEPFVGQFILKKI